MIQKENDSRRRCPRFYFYPWLPLTEKTERRSLRYGCESWQNSSSTTYFANEVVLLSPTKYYFYRPCSTTSFSHPFDTWLTLTDSTLHLSRSFTPNRRRHSGLGLWREVDGVHSCKAVRCSKGCWRNPCQGHCVGYPITPCREGQCNALRWLVHRAVIERNRPLHLSVNGLAPTVPPLTLLLMLRETKVGRLSSGVPRCVIWTCLSSYLLFWNGINHSKIT